MGSFETPGQRVSATEIDALYDKNDPRAALASSSAAPIGATRFAGAEYGRFDRDAPVDADAHGRGWYLRGQNFVLHYVEALEGGCFARVGQPDEYALIVPVRDMALEIDAGADTVSVSGGSVVFVPEADTIVRATRDRKSTRLNFSH